MKKLIWGVHFMLIFSQTILSSQVELNNDCSMMRVNANLKQSRPWIPTKSILEFGESKDASFGYIIYESCKHGKRVIPIANELIEISEALEYAFGENQFKEIKTKGKLCYLHPDQSNSITERNGFIEELDCFHWDKLSMLEMIQGEGKPEASNAFSEEHKQFVEQIGNNRIRMYYINEAYKNSFLSSEEEFRKYIKDPHYAEKVMISRAVRSGFKKANKK